MIDHKSKKPGPVKRVKGISNPDTITAENSKRLEAKPYGKRTDRGNEMTFEKYLDGKAKGKNVRKPRVPIFRKKEKDKIIEYDDAAENVNYKSQNEFGYENRDQIRNIPISEVEEINEQLSKRGQNTLEDEIVNLAPDYNNNYNVDNKNMQNYQNFKGIQLENSQASHFEPEKITVTSMNQEPIIVQVDQFTANQFVDNLMKEDLNIKNNLGNERMNNNVRG